MPRLELSPSLRSHSFLDGPNPVGRRSGQDSLDSLRIDRPAELGLHPPRRSSRKLASAVVPPGP